MTQLQTKNKSIQLILFLFVILQAPLVQSQRIFTSTGILVSMLDNDISMSKYKGAVIRSSTGLGFETKQWHRLSLTVALSNFTSGGKKQSNSYSNFENYDHLYFNNYSVGAIGNFYMVNRKTQFYFGIGPRLDYVRSQHAIYTEWDGNGYAAYFLRTYLFGISGNIGVNFQLDNFNLGIKSNYYYRPYVYKKGYENMYGEGSHFIRDNVFDLQLVFGYTLGKRKPVK